MTARRVKLDRGYTLIEVLVVVTIIGIAGAVVVPHLLESGTLGVQAAARAVVADILYAQNDAIAQQAVRRVVFNVDDNSYVLTDGAGNKLQVSWRSGGGEGYEVSFSSDSRFEGVRLVKADFDNGAVLQFDNMGTPALSTDGVVELEYNGQRYRIQVAAFTGRVTVLRL